jgi:hypothetical protein
MSLSNTNHLPLVFFEKDSSVPLWTYLEDEPTSSVPRDSTSTACTDSSNSINDAETQIDSTQDIQSRNSHSKIELAPARRKMGRPLAKKVKCHCCDKVYDSLGLWRRHYQHRNRDVIRRYQYKKKDGRTLCIVKSCNRDFSRQDKMILHVFKHHAQDEVIECGEPFGHNVKTAEQLTSWWKVCSHQQVEDIMTKLVKTEDDMVKTEETGTKDEDS